MTVYGCTGQVVHFNNCAYCKLRKVTRISAKHELETCSLTEASIPAPRQGARYCQSYQQENCACPACNIVLTDVSLTLQRENAKMQCSNTRSVEKPASDNQGLEVWGALWGGS